MTEQMKKRVSHKWRVAFFVSLAGNIAILGIVVGTVLGGERGAHGRLDGAKSAARMGPVGQVVRALPREDRRALGQAMRQLRDDSHASFGTPAAQMDAWISALSAQPFDAARLSKLIAIGRANQNARGQLGGDLLIEKITAMSDAERDELVENLRRDRERGFGSKSGLGR